MPPESRSRLYPAQDSLDRLREYQRGTLELVKEHVQVDPDLPIDLPGTDKSRTYDLDGLGNWRRTTYAPVGGSQATEVRRHNYVNQLTRFGTTPVLYDHGDNAADADPDIARRGNGNVADDGTRTYAYDGFNRVVQVKRKADSVIIAEYSYDAMGRRVVAAIRNGGLTGNLTNRETFSFYAGMQCIEDCAAREYVWGQYVDELIQQKELAGEDPPTYYPLGDLLYRTTALTDADKDIVEAYDYDAYGRTLIFDAPGTSGWFSNNDQLAAPQDPKCRYLFTGREYDAELSDASTQIYFYRARYYSPALGRFLSRDPIGYLGSMSLYDYANGRALVARDPFGLTIIIYPTPSVEDPEAPCRRCCYLHRTYWSSVRNYYAFELEETKAWDRAQVAMSRARAAIAAILSIDRSRPQRELWETYSTGGLAQYAEFLKTKAWMTLLETAAEPVNPIPGPYEFVGGLLRGSEGENVGMGIELVVGVYDTASGFVEAETESRAADVLARSYREAVNRSMSSEFRGLMAEMREAEAVAEKEMKTALMMTRWKQVEVKALSEARDAYLREGCSKILGGKEIDERETPPMCKR